MPNFAAWIEGVDLTEPLSAAVQAELRQALYDFQVIFFKPQVITPQQHLALAQLIGVIKAFKSTEHPVFWMNPDSKRKCLFLNADFTRRILGADRHEADGMVQFLLNWMKKP